MEMLREGRSGWGAVLGRSWRSSFSLVARLRNGLDNLRLSLPEVDGRGGGFWSAVASGIRALHDLARLRIFRASGVAGLGVSA